MENTSSAQRSLDVDIVNVRIDGRRGYEARIGKFRQLWVMGKHRTLALSFSSATASDPRDDPALVTIMEASDSSNSHAPDMPLSVCQR
jgi:hypothetical protein